MDPNVKWYSGFTQPFDDCNGRIISFIKNFVFKMIFTLPPLPRFLIQTILLFFYFKLKFVFEIILTRSTFEQILFSFISNEIQKAFIKLWNIGYEQIWIIQKQGLSKNLWEKLLLLSKTIFLGLRKTHVFVIGSEQTQHIKSNLSRS